MRYDHTGREVDLVELSTEEYVLPSKKSRPDSLPAGGICHEEGWELTVIDRRLEHSTTYVYENEQRHKVHDDPHLMVELGNGMAWDVDRHIYVVRDEETKMIQKVVRLQWWDSGPVPPWNLD